MKKLTMKACMFAALCFGIACNGNEGQKNNEDSSTQTTVSATKDSPAVQDQTSAMTNKDTGAAMSMDIDKDFMMDAASGGMMEVEMGKLAMTNAMSQKVKDFGKMMIADHTKANMELKALAGKKNMTIPAAPNEVHQKHIDMMKEMKGKDFDKAYVDMMSDDHEKDVAKFDAQATGGKDADIKAFAAKTLPVLKKHLSGIKAIKSLMK